MSTQAPSHFANLLRQSRFASFDPAIGNVYASYGGHAHRGNWGLKRPLPLRRRKGNVRVQAIDSIAQQTEWTPAERQARWIQMWEEVGVTPKTSDGSWMDKLGTTGLYRWEVDSEFAPAPMPASRPQKTGEAAEKTRLSPETELTKEAKEKGEDENSSEAIPNIYSMTEREFERYLEKLREMRPAFLKYLEEKSKPDEQGRLWQRRRSVEGDDYRRFLMAQAGQEYRSHDSRIIEQKPQRYGGLVYSPQSLLQSKLTTEATPGRILATASAHGSPDSGDYVTSFAGMTPHLHKRSSENRAPLNWRSLGASTDSPDAMRGITPMRMAYARLISAPGTAQKPRDLLTVKMEMEVYVPPQIEHGTQNPYPPGSREYVGHQIAPERNMTQPRTSSRKSQLKEPDWIVKGASGKDVLNTLHVMLSVPKPLAHKPDQF
ncbi:hypothetical protein FOMPIDRAFT_1062104 [Fomitopsis schrenkii]|uniref:Uncharacterized protein n=1 Tax=Fomitopsis schrenkii TaxID=2126942 RepID=S8FEL2_FOMSC|nr:hypothetical protein FOMPIDRAFT_1062104 [Fomitopsis schrenkii]